MAGELEFSEELKVAVDAPQAKGFRVWPYRLLLLVLLWLELMFTAGCIATVLQVMPQKNLLLVSGAVCGLFWLCFFSINKRWRFLLLFVYLVLVVFLFTKNFALVQDGAREIGNAASLLIHSYFKIYIGYWRVSENAALSTAVLFSFAMQLVCACYAQLLFRARGAFLSTLFLAAAAFFGLAVGTVPEGIYFIGAVFCALFQLVFGRMYSEYCVRDGKVFKKNEGEQKKRAQTALFFGVLTAMLGLVISYVLSNEVYREKMDMGTKKQELMQELDKVAAMPVWAKISDTFSEVFDFDGIGKGKTSTTKLGGLNSGRFSRAGQVSFDNVTALVVTMPEVDRAVYLKGYTGARYTSTGWEELPAKAQREYEEIIRQHGIIAQELGYRLMELFYGGRGPFMLGAYSWGDVPVIRQGKMQVEYITANKRYVYAPYYINPFERGEYRYGEDGYLLSKNQEGIYDFTFDLPSEEFLEYFADFAEKQGNTEDSSEIFYFWGQDDETVALLEFEEQYREFVYQNYTQVPQGHEQLEGLLYSAAGASVDDKIKAVQRYLSRYEYTLSPGEMPKDADFVNYFLLENKKGYCVHFASAAVLLLRSLGVPARYAEGYLITAQDIARADASGAESLSYVEEPICLLSSYIKGVRTQVVLQKRIEVRDYTAHAWVEVYRDEVGWVPVEVTGGYMDNTRTGSRPSDHRASVADLPTPTPVPTKAVTPTPLPTNPPATPSPKPENPTNAPKTTSTPAPSQGAEPKVSVTPGAPKPSPGADREDSRTLAQRHREIPHWVWTVFRLVLFLAGAILLIFLRYRIVWRVRRDGRKTRQNQVLWCYWQMERILMQQGIAAAPQEDCEAFARRVAGTDICVAGEFVRCQKTALMAGFGRERITREDCMVLEKNYHKMREDLLGKVSRVQRWYLKFIKLY